MKKSFRQGFFAGLLVAAVAASLCVTALAASRTITIDDDIRVTINGAAFIPRNANGEEVPLLTYNGTIYAPIRAICEEAGMKVDYDASSRTALITTASTPAASPPANTGTSTVNGYITEERAKEIALNHAGVSAADAVWVHVKLDRDSGHAEFEVEFYAGNTEYDYDIDAVTGEIRSFDHDVEDFRIPSSSTANATSYISADRAKEIALGQAPSGATVVKCKLDTDDHRVVYELELRSGHTEYECKIDAVTGTILSWEKD